jgi:hypothetical protein
MPYIGTSTYKIIWTHKIHNTSKAQYKSKPTNTTNIPLSSGEVAGVAVLVCILGAYFVVRRRKKNVDKSRSIDLFMTPCLYVLV